MPVGTEAVDNGSMAIESALAVTGVTTALQDPRFANLDGHGVTTVVIDTGIDLDHSFFGPDANQDGIADRIIYQYDFANGDPDASDVARHGSHVASLIGSQDALYPGVAPGTDLIALKVFEDSGAGYFSYLEKALQWVIANREVYHIGVVNLSLGDAGNWTNTLSRYGVGDELAELAAQDVIVVGAAGNNYYQYGRLGVAYPASDPAVIAVGATWAADFGGPWRINTGATDYSTGVDHIASWSQRDGTLVDTFAPGARFNGANATGGIRTMQGTSQAAAFVSGVAALSQQLALQELGRGLTTGEFALLLQETGDTIIDGDDEIDNVPNSGLSYPRINFQALAERILTLDDAPAGGGGTPGGGAGSDDLLQQAAPGVYQVSLTAGQAAASLDFGNFKLGGISGVKFEDVDGDGARDPGEPGLAGFTIYLDANSNGALDMGEVSTVTDGTGAYAFTDLGPGAYRVREVSQAGWALTAPAGGTYEITMTSGLTAAARDFGNCRLTQAQVNRYSFVYTYDDGGDYYYGEAYATAADAPSLVAIAASDNGYGHYDWVDMASGFDPGLDNTVQVTAYVDTHSGHMYAASNTAGDFGSETAHFSGDGGQAFNFSPTSAVDALNRYDFVFWYDSGDYYYGSVYATPADVPTLLAATSTVGHYQFVDMASGFAPPANPVQVTAYVDTNSGHTYAASNTAGDFGSETAHFSGDGGQAFDFGPTSAADALNRYSFVYWYDQDGSGDYYYGEVYATVADVPSLVAIAASDNGYGHYDWVDMAYGFAAPANPVQVTAYVETNSRHTYAASNTTMPFGSESAGFYGDGCDYFDFGPASAADALNRYDFVFWYDSGDYYYGSVYATPADVPTLLAASSLQGHYQFVDMAYGFAPPANPVQVSAYVDTNSGHTYAADSTVGVLGAETSQFQGDGGHAFSFTAANAADALNRYSFVYSYNDGSGDYYHGEVYATVADVPSLVAIAASDNGYGHYDWVDMASGFAPPANPVQVTAYYDDSTRRTYAADSTVGGLGSESARFNGDGGDAFSFSAANSVDAVNHNSTAYQPVSDRAPGHGRVVAGSPVTAAALAPIVTEAMARWGDTLAGNATIMALNQVEFKIADLPGALLGQAVGNTIVIDADAAGYGWFIDPTPADNQEFGRPNLNGEGFALPLSPAAAGMDLLTAVMHEFGHVLGFEHQAQGVMAATLKTGERLILTDVSIPDNGPAPCQASRPARNDTPPLPAPPRRFMVFDEAKGELVRPGLGLARPDHRDLKFYPSEWDGREDRESGDDWIVDYHPRKLHG